jgi:hypothetical protein
VRKGLNLNTAPDSSDSEVRNLKSSVHTLMVLPCWSRVSVYSDPDEYCHTKLVFFLVFELSAFLLPWARTNRALNLNTVTVATGSYGV